MLVCGAIINQANEGAAADSLSFLFGSSVLCVYAAPRPGIRTPSAGYTFNWNGRVGGFMRVLRFRMEWLKSDRVEGEMAYDQKIVAPTLGAFLYNVLT